MKVRQYFPLGKAHGKAFCNRTKETEKLVGNIMCGKHTFIVAPRRYGKSSLCETAFEKSGLPWTKVDFHLSVSERDAERFIIKGIMELIGKSISQIDKLSKVIAATVKNLNPKFNLKAGPFALELEINNKSTPAENVYEAIVLLEKLLVEKDEQAVLLFDEFQEVGEIAKGRGIEGAIRSAAQDTQNLVIVFSGSNPHLIRNMFENDRRPLYKMCKRLVLDRIDQEHYRSRMAPIAELKWNKDLPHVIFEKIMQLTEQHPYYINALCDEIWCECDNIPSLEDIENCWQGVVESERSDLVKDFLSLSDNQRRIAIHIANIGGNEIFSGDAAKEMSIAPGSLSATLSALIEKDFVERVGDKYRLVVPAYKSILKEK